MDIATIIGLIGSFSAIILGLVTGGASLLIYVDIPSMIITIVGSIAATATANSLEIMKKVVSIGKNAVFPPKYNPSETILALVSFSEKARREGLLALEDDLEEVSDPFLRKGVQLVVDGTEPELVRNIMESELEALNNRHVDAKKIFAHSFVNHYCGFSIQPRVTLLIH